MSLWSSRKSVLPLMWFQENSSLMNRIPINTWIRFIIPLLLALFFGVMITLQSLFREPIGFRWYGLLWITITTFTIWETNLRLSLQLDTRLPWNDQFFRRLGIQLMISYAVSIGIFLSFYLVLNWYENTILHNDNPLSLIHLASGATLGFMLTTFINVIQIGHQLIQVREAERLRAERYQRESIEARLESLRQQIDPHFLFNNFSTLYSLIHEDTEKAGIFLLKLSDIYRLVLEHLDRESVSVREELELIRVYTDLLAIRHGTALQFDLDIPPEILEQQLIPFALQLLVENAIKHNQVESDHPLRIRIYYAEGRGLCVENNLIPRSSVPVSAKIGLKNLEERHRFRLGQSISIIRDRRRFSVAVPLFNE